ncbi:MAG: ABC transporter permease [Candidatus Tectomicrobia bacterium]|nr:ABC transporter permease [Candidatus Tectomicrobia bacterium]
MSYRFRNLVISLRMLTLHRLRTFLTLLGVVMGVSLVIAMVSIGEGTKAEVVEKIRNLGANLLIVRAGQVRLIAGRPRPSGVVTTLTVRDAEVITQEKEAIDFAVPAYDRKAKLKYGNQRTEGLVVGTTPELQVVVNFFPEQGRFFTHDEVSGGVRVVILGKKVWRNLFGSQNPIGEKIRIENVTFEVIGVMREKGISGPGADDPDSQLFIPITAALRRLFNLTYINTIFVRAKSESLIKGATEQIISTLRERHHIRRGRLDDFTIFNQKEILDTEREASQTFTVLLGGIAAMALIIGGVGILAVMLMAVQERTREIGLRRAVGARKRDILLQFLAEALTLSLIGGIIGIVVGVAGARVAAFFMEWPVVTPWRVSLFAFVFSAAIGLFFGLYPAQKAARLNPIESLRFE